MATALSVLMHDAARQVLAKAAALGYDPQLIAERVAKKLNDAQEERYKRLLAASAAIRTGDRTAHRALKSGGHEIRKTFEIPLTSYHYWGQRLGYECWQDKGFISEILRDNPEWRVEYARETRITSGIAFDGAGTAVA